MEWSSSVPAAITRCKRAGIPLLILIEPAATAEHRLAKLSTASLHKYLFTNPTVQKLLNQASIIPVKIVADGNHDYNSFTQFFRHAAPPDILLVSCEGVVMWSRCGFVSPRVFVENVARVCDIDTTGWFGEREKSAVLILPPTPNLTQIETAHPEEEPPKNSTDPVMPKSHALEKRSDRAMSEEIVVVNAPKSGMTLPKQTKTKLQARLPSGESVNNSYLPTTQFHSIRSWLSQSAELPKDRMLIATAFPRQVFDNADDTKTLAELDLCPSASLIVSDIGGADHVQSSGMGIVETGRNALAGIRGVVTGFFGSFLATGNRRGEFLMGESDAPPSDEGRERERDRGLDDENLRYNGNSTQFGYDDDDR